MPPSMPRSSSNSPRCKRRSRARASEGETSVKTAIGQGRVKKGRRESRGAGGLRTSSELHHVPDPVAGGAIAASAGGLEVAALAALGLHVVGGHLAVLGLHGNAAGGATHAQFVDAAATVFVLQAFGALLDAAVTGRSLLLN